MSAMNASQLIAFENGFPSTVREAHRIISAEAADENGKSVPPPIYNGRRQGRKTRKMSNSTTQRPHQAGLTLYLHCQLSNQNQLLTEFDSILAFRSQKFRREGKGAALEWLLLILDTQTIRSIAATGGRQATRERKRMSEPTVRRDCQVISML
jgi:hypothetical protein